MRIARTLQFGYRYLADEAEAAGEKLCRRTACRICSTGGWASSISKKGRGRHRKAGPPVHDDLVERDVFHTRAKARFAVAEYIEVFYNRRRPHSSLCYHTPARAWADAHQTAAEDPPGAA